MHIFPAQCRKLCEMMQCLDGDEDVYSQRISLQGSGLGWVVEILSCDYAEKLCEIMHYYAMSGLGPFANLFRAQFNDSRIILFICCVF
jgi:hypothetical protein